MERIAWAFKWELKKKAIVQLNDPLHTFIKLYQTIKNAQNPDFTRFCFVTYFFMRKIYRCRYDICYGHAEK